MSESSLAALIDGTAEAILDAAKVDGLPLMGKLWTLSVEDDSVLLRIQAVNNRPVPRTPPPPPPTKTPPPPPTKPGGGK